MVDIKYSQNLYTNGGNLRRIIDAINLNSFDTVIDIGAGKGVITQELVKHCDNVIAYELDPRYFDILEKLFKDNPNVILRKEDFLTSTLPNKKYKVFANIPFSLTSDIINKITDIDSRLVEAFLFVQKESSERYMGIFNNTQIATILSSTYDLCVIENFDRRDFNPIPNVDVVLLRITKKDNPETEVKLYRDFVTYIFNQMNGNVLDTLKKLFTFNQLKYIKKQLKRNGYNIPSDIPSKYYLEIFQYFKTNGLDYRKRVEGYYTKHINQHLGREKINRTRI
ncbi:MAG TPA: rRNA adenine N(6)-methyltransferase family protein [Candidatus Dojkabacteria bacterium]|nr:rRNA adenine N(6)-methyltransferase family protein [Candidatus Dojkabacteria bacterium]HOR05982.1 rRNA adenine N(6)-methyltransferase family protein [Candidatus Dojkabacteria bacterium]HQI92628.1 rRNA adenine N(6)-methyltransferase family protein [Candidatus Dojkabacteria bacterium]